MKRNKPITKEETANLLDKYLAKGRTITMCPTKVPTAGGFFMNELSMVLHTTELEQGEIAKWLR